MSVLKRRVDGQWVTVLGGGDSHEHDASQVTSGVFVIARLPVAASGSSSTTQVVRADDSRLSNARTPTAHSHTISDLPVATSGTSNSTQLVRADDSRLSNARTPTAHTHTIADLPVATSGTSNTTQLVRADDARLSNARTPVAHTHTKSEITDFAHTHAIGDLPVAASGASSATQVVRADDSRLSNARTPVAHTHSKSEITDFAHSHVIEDLPVATSGTSNSTQLVRADDARLSDARTPTTHTHTKSQITDFAHTHAIGDLPVATSGTSNSTQLVRADDARLSNARTPTAHTHTKANITDFAHTHSIADLDVTGTPSSSTYLRGDGIWATVATGVGPHTHSATDVTTGTLIDGVMPGRLGTPYAMIVSSSDCNNLTSTGFYRGVSMTNAPNGGAGWWFIKVIGHDTLWTWQEAVGFTGSDDGTEWRRWKRNGTWSAWERVYGDLATLDALYMRNDSTDGAVFRAMNNITGGGTVSVDGSYNVKWTTRFICIANGRGSHFGTVGYFDIGMPSVGTVIPAYGGASSATVTSSGVPLAQWHALYYELPIGGVQTSLNGNFRVVTYTSNFVVPDHWVLIAIRGENGQVRFCNGFSLVAGQSASASNPNPQYALTSHTHSILPGSPQLGDTNASVVKTEGVTLDVGTLTLENVYTNGVLTQVREKNGATVIKTTTLNYTGDVLTSIVEVAGGITVTTTFSYSGGAMTGATKTVA